MKRLFLLLLLISVSLFTFQSCETDFDVTAPYKDITVVYGMLSQNDTVHYLKINKAFIGEGNALEYAQNADSSFYGDNLEVILKEISNGNVLRTLSFDTTTVYDKEPGIFYAPNQVLYKSTFIIQGNAADLEYDLEIRNKITGELITANTPLVSEFSVESPRPLRQINFTIESPQRIKWSSAKNGKRYTVSLRFWFDEVMAASNDTIQRYIDWNFSSVKSNSIQGGESLEILYVPTAFFSICKSLIPYKETSQISEDAISARLANHVEFLFAVAGDELNTYMEVNEPSSGIVQEKPDYTNIDNGIGIFSCRYTQSTASSLFFTRLNDATENRLIDENIKFVETFWNK
ncbi:MAG: hypothetical protein RBS07_10150 [Lentimicrobium sp.]|nr:hypothetical protein [Lentimicrobium sp.]